MATFTINRINLETGKESKKVLRTPKQVTNNTLFEQEVQKVYNAFLVDNALIRLTDVKPKKDELKPDYDARVEVLGEQLKKAQDFVKSHGGIDNVHFSGLPAFTAWLVLGCRTYNRKPVMGNTAVGNITSAFRLYCDSSNLKGSLIYRVPTKDEVKKAFVNMVTLCTGDTSAYGKQFTVRMTDDMLDRLKAWYLAPAVKYGQHGIKEQVRTDYDIIEQGSLRIMAKMFGFDDDKMIQHDSKGILF